MLPLIRDSALWTMGSDNADGDWEAAWKRRIAQLPGHHKGSGVLASLLRAAPRTLTHLQMLTPVAHGSCEVTLPVQGSAPLLRWRRTW